MTTITALDYVLTTKKFTKAKEHTIYIDFLGVRIWVTQNRKWFNITYLKRQIDRAAQTKSDNAKKWSHGKFGELLDKDPNAYKDLFGDGDVWVSITEWNFVLPLLLSKRLKAIRDFGLGRANWRDHLYEFIYIRCDPKFKRIDWIVKGGREMNPRAREDNYKHHAVEDGCGTVFWLFCVKYASPAEHVLKEVLKKHFLKPKKSLSGKKLGKEHFFASTVESDEDLVALIDDVAVEFQNAMDADESNEVFCSWSHYDFEETGETMNDFVKFCMPWAMDLGK